MDARTREEVRQDVGQRRIRPHEPQRIFVAADGLGECDPLEPRRAIELHIEATSNDGHPSPWLTDDWWIQIQALCAGRSVTIVLLPTSGAILEELILHQLDMVRRIAPQWRMIGYAHVDETRKHPTLDQWVRAPYDEIRLCVADGQTRKAALIAAEQLVTQAALCQRLPGTHQACLRLTHALPKPISPASRGAAVQDEDVAQLHRIFEPGAVKSAS